MRVHSSVRSVRAPVLGRRRTARTAARWAAGVVAAPPARAIWICVSSSTERTGVPAGLVDAQREARASARAACSTRAAPSTAKASSGTAPAQRARAGHALRPARGSASAGRSARAPAALMPVERSRGRAAVGQVAAPASRSCRVELPCLMPGVCAGASVGLPACRASASPCSGLAVPSLPARGPRAPVELVEERADLLPHLRAAGQPAPARADQPDERVALVDRHEPVARARRARG